MEKLKNIRLEHNFKQSEIANLLEIGQQAYSQYELGKRKLPVEVAKRLGKIMNFEWWKLYED